MAITGYDTVSTELEAVNEMLRSIGASPVNSLTGPLPADADSAHRLLRLTTRELCIRGWVFNTEKAVELSPNGAGEIALPDNTLRVDTVACDAKTDVTYRAGKLYDRREHTFVFDRSVTVDLTVLIPFVDLPENARWFITVRAARKLQSGSMGSAQLAGFTQADEAAAIAILLDTEAEDGDYNMVTGHPIGHAAYFRYVRR